MRVSPNHNKASWAVVSWSGLLGRWFFAVKQPLPRYVPLVWRSAHQKSVTFSRFVETIHRTIDHSSPEGDRNGRNVNAKESEHVYLGHCM